jgi:hypothetical protein
VLSPFAAPVPVALPSQERGELAGPIDPFAGTAERTPPVEKAKTKSIRPNAIKRAPIVTRPAIEYELLFIRENAELRVRTSPSPGFRSYSSIDEAMSACLRHSYDYKFVMFAQRA